MILLKKLYTWIFRQENAITWFANYFSSQTQFVQLEGCTSSIMPVCKGVPQGSVLGPILFYFYLNNICDNTNVRYHLYADDTVYYCSASSA